MAASTNKEALRFIKNRAKSATLIPSELWQSHSNCGARYSPRTAPWDSHPAPCKSVRNLLVGHLQTRVAFCDLCPNHLQRRHLDCAKVGIIWHQEIRDPIPQMLWQKFSNTPKARRLRNGDHMPENVLLER